MRRYVVLRVGQAVLVMWLVATLTFFVFRILPGDAATVALGTESSPQARAAFRHETGLDRPLLVQYFSWLGNLFRGDLGTSYTQGNQKVAGLIGSPLWHTLQLAIVATVIAILVSIPLAMLSASRPGSPVDQLSRGLAVVGFSLPSFWLGIILLLIFTSLWHVLPAGGYIAFTESPIGYLRGIVLPAVAVSFILTGIFVRFLRASLLDTFEQDYVRTARAKGLRERTVDYRHALRNALLPFITVAGMEFGLLIGGLVVVEQVFNWPGIGQLLVQGILNRSYDLVEAAVLVMALVFVVVNTLVDISYRLLDPRIVSV